MSRKGFYPKAFVFIFIEFRLYIYLNLTLDAGDRNNKQKVIPRITKISKVL